MCGEKPANPVEEYNPGGSPPRVRGEGDVQRVRRAVVGITPACAGRSAALSPGSAEPADHPRVCGEKSPPLYVSAVLAGSPPRVRGEAIRKTLHDKRVRITPACAGRRIL